MLYVVAGLFAALLLGSLAGISNLFGGAAAATALDETTPAPVPQAGGSLPRIAAYDPSHDRLVLSYDPAGGRPLVTVALDPTDLHNGIVFANGRAVAVIGGGAALMPDAIELEPAAA